LCQTPVPQKTSAWHKRLYNAIRQAGSLSAKSPNRTGVSG
jgi:hypothetical protein